MGRTLSLSNCGAGVFVRRRDSALPLRAILLHRIRYACWRKSGSEEEMVRAPLRGSVVAQLQTSRPRNREAPYVSKVYRVPQPAPASTGASLRVDVLFA